MVHHCMIHHFIYATARLGGADAVLQELCRLARQRRDTDAVRRLTKYRTDIITTPLYIAYH